MGARQIILFCLGIVACVAVAWGLVTLVKPYRGAGPGGGSAVIATKGADVGGAFTLTDHNGRRVSDADFRGRFMLIFFGYTFCPDVCPLELQTIGRAMEILGAKGKKITPVFITVDPARDTPAHLKDYVTAFHPRLVGLTGSSAEIAAVAKAYKVYYGKSAGTKAGATDYLVDHSAFIYLMGPGGKLTALLRPKTKPEELAREIARFVQ
jgi:protein SCO1/2